MNANHEAWFKQFRERAKTLSRHIVLPEGVEFASIRHDLSALQIAELTTILPAETFRGGSLAAGTYSFLLRVRFQSAERTLRDDEVTQWSQQIVKAVESLGGSLRQ